MTERARLSDASAFAARPREREYAIHDTTLQGFLLRVQPNGARSWVLRFRWDGKPVPRHARQAWRGEGRRGAGRSARIPRAREGRRKAPSRSSFRPDAEDVRCRICGTAFARMEAVYCEGDHELPQQRHPAGSWPSPRRCRRAPTHRPLFPRIRTPQAGRREPLS